MLSFKWWAFWSAPVPWTSSEPIVLVWSAFSWCPRWPLPFGIHAQYNWCTIVWVVLRFRDTGALSHWTTVFHPGWTMGYEGQNARRCRARLQSVSSPVEGDHFRFSSFNLSHVLYPVSLVYQLVTNNRLQQTLCFRNNYISVMGFFLLFF